MVNSYTTYSLTTFAENLKFVKPETISLLFSTISRDKRTVSSEYARHMWILDNYHFISNLIQYDKAVCLVFRFHLFCLESENTQSADQI